MADLKGRQNNASELRNREALIITGINRYIVGCKLKILKCTFLVLAELIDTKWDVNTGVRQVKKMRSFELIDT